MGTLPDPPTEADFTTRLRSATVAARVGLWLGICFGICFVPVLGRFGARPDNPTLLDRHYLVAWLVLVGVVLLATVVWSLLRARRRAGR